MSEGTHVISVFAPMNGKVIDLSEVPDQLYSKRILGDGVAIVPSEWEMYSPTDGYISVIADMAHKHATSETEYAGAFVPHSLAVMQLSADMALNEAKAILIADCENGGGYA